MDSLQQITEKEKSSAKEEAEENWGGADAFKLLVFIKDLDEEIKKNSQLLVFFSANWCHHCLKLRKPYGMAALMAHKANVKMVFGTFDVATNPDLAQEKGVLGVPLIKYYKDGQFIANYKGKRTSEELFEFAKDPPKMMEKPVKPKVDF